MLPARSATSFILDATLPGKDAYSLQVWHKARVVYVAQLERPRCISLGVTIFCICIALLRDSTHLTSASAFSHVAA